MHVWFQVAFSVPSGNWQLSSMFPRRVLSRTGECCSSTLHELDLGTKAMLVLCDADA
jgi:hypothetical protein